MKNFIKNHTYVFTLLFLAFITSCSKNIEPNINNGVTTIKFNVSTIENNQQQGIKKKGSLSAATNNLDIQVGTIAFSKDINLVYELIPENSDNQEINKIVANKNGLKANTPIKNQLGNGIKYRILAYDTNGELKADKIYTNQEASQEGMTLNAGEKYTFIAYSINSNSELPEIENENNLNTVKLVNVTGDLMYQKIPNVELVVGQNYLDIVLKHQFTSITTVLKIEGPDLQGSFEAIENVLFSNTSKSANLTFSDENLTYNNESTNVESVFDSIIGKTVVTSKPAILINEESSIHKLTFEKIQIGKDVKEGSNRMIINDIKILPGVKYKLVLTFKTCLDNITPTPLSWSCSTVTGSGQEIGCRFINGKSYNFGDLLHQEYNDIPNADDGFIFDIYDLDNSINMTVNNQKIFDQEIQFQRKTGQLQNIRFKDGDRYGYKPNEKHDIDNTTGGTGQASTKNTKDVKEIYQINNAAAVNNKVVLLKIIISKDGTVQMFGRKTTGSDLEELELFDIKTNMPLEFNTVHWYGTSSGVKNVVKVSQFVDGITLLVGSGYGRKKVPCNP